MFVDCFHSFSKCLEMGFRINPSGSYILIGSKEEKLIDKGEKSRATEDNPGNDVITRIDEEVGGGGETGETHQWWL